MYFHQHTVTENEEEAQVYVLHVNAEEAVALVEVIQQALVDNPGAENFSINLGKAEE